MSKMVEAQIKQTDNKAQTIILTAKPFRSKEIINRCFVIYGISPFVKKFWVSEDTKWTDVQDIWHSALLTLIKSYYVNIQTLNN